ncbi:natural resistance-associated macrophage protein-domain-containing protein [Zychaea mexicana]|uniref:natural resistance-associated macrophage protein-domain-containing protein n=1 Tax=Zychaea mexicana TaxID=64656 RepID=UPI0022FDC405|nr:natural resistance-associated macrophage protein-domain-containing protein [Zychaea mexicana]KAI9495834.1 natural resistance-associated macrophage protein-domain-containing protein [Zychaea mexicana]
MFAYALGRCVKFVRKFSKFIGPGFMIAVGYLDPGNWATDMEGGSQFGYRLLFIILLSNVIAVFLQNLTIRLGVVSGLDLASASRRYLPKYLNLFLYVLAELAIIATDMAEVIGSAIALNLLIPQLPLPAGVAITAADVFIILLFYSEDHTDPDSQTETASLRVIRLFETFVMMLVLAVGICLSIILAYSDINPIDVVRGYKPVKEIFTDTASLYVSIGIIGATVMPHNLYLHGFIVQARCREWRAKRPQAETIDDDNKQWILSSVARKFVLEGPEKPSEAETRVSMDHTTAEKKHFNAHSLRRYIKSSLRDNLLFNFIDLVIALLFAFYVNSAILIVAASNFYYAPAGQQQEVTDLFDAHELLSRYLSPAAGVIFALALLCAGQSSTITATLAGQVVMSGFLGMSTRPWVRRIVTRLVAIVPALVAACIAGRSGLSQLLVGSQVALSVQLPFAVVPLVIFTSWKKVMKVELVVDKSNPAVDRGKVTMSWIDKLFPRMPTWRPSWWQPAKQKLLPRLQWGEKGGDSPTIVKTDTSSSIATESPVVLNELPEPLIYNNGWIVKIVACLISALLIGLNGYLVVAAALGL